MPVQPDKTFCTPPLMVSIVPMPPLALRMPMSCRPPYMVATVAVPPGLTVWTPPDMLTTVPVPPLLTVWLLPWFMLLMVPEPPSKISCSAALPATMEDTMPTPPAEMICLPDKVPTVPEPPERTWKPDPPALVIVAVPPACTSMVPAERVPYATETPSITRRVPPERA